MYYYRKSLPRADFKEWTEREFEAVERAFSQLFTNMQQQIDAINGAPSVVIPGAARLIVTGRAPTVLGGNTNVAVGAGALTVTGAAPTVTRQEVAVVDAGALTVAGHAPTITT